ncbi:4-(cytidine 5'-diphospho)-2-C-methyl-D-erythritol kinase [Sphingosinicella rhizophila]|uniref:4-diphosphocytidyl-2-C-methyl-D-erythritol kinase n=1 Tax=Sphingosinicella rhizophila TaxID=3050082 RepID=A0ABU3Q282_9SPHN|nr:4-(cytidine 5'-diphospho)-2-C-methyl-D-erythritol kinase [Sphingosinicella sp. GR2756]MDT9597528.1 4-(cytidine 5'-diphospho)-2-C-methyl-D-erythritol kinase [Sphingosinicella sp. GR2756]
MEEPAFAKINLALHVRSREDDGYHRIETLFAFAEEGDRLHAEPADTLTLALCGPFAGQLGEENLVLRAAHAVRRAYDIGSGAALTLEKNLPVASGIGGGSADAAAALRLLPRLWGVEASQDDMTQIARALGSDVPACLHSHMVRGEGRGDILSSQDGSGLSGMPLLLVNPGVALATSDVFRAWDGLDRGPMPAAAPLVTALDGRNDLEAPAVGLVPLIGRVLDMLHGTSAVLSRMSGSGATCFALFEREEERDRARDLIQVQSPGWWQLATRLR